MKLALPTLPIIPSFSHPSLYLATHTSTSPPIHLLYIATHPSRTYSKANHKFTDSEMRIHKRNAGLEFETVAKKQHINVVSSLDLQRIVKLVDDG
jgi:hypothetical protein